jgi:hypothetical protein
MKVKDWRVWAKLMMIFKNKKKYNRRKAKEELRNERKTT